MRQSEAIERWCYRHQITVKVVKDQWQFWVGRTNLKWWPKNAQLVINNRLQKNRRILTWDEMRLVLEENLQAQAIEKGEIPWYDPDSEELR